MMNMKLLAVVTPPSIYQTAGVSTKVNSRKKYIYEVKLSMFEAVYIGNT